MIIGVCLTANKKTSNNKTALKPKGIAAMFASKQAKNGEVVMSSHCVS